MPTLRFFVSDKRSRSRGTIARVMHRCEALENGGRRECRVFVAPAAPQVRRNSPALPAQWFYGLFRALPGVPGLIASITAGFSPAGLIPASGDQDHTALPSAPVSHAWQNLHVHRILLQRLWRLAKRPSRPKQDARIEPHISEKRKLNIFASRAGHVGQISDRRCHRQPTTRDNKPGLGSLCA